MTLDRSCRRSTTPTGSCRARTSETTSRPTQYPLRGRAPADHAYGIATLEEVIDATAGVVLNLDIKRRAPHVVPYEHAVADLLRERERVDDVIVASFLDAATDEVRSYAPEIATLGREPSPSPSSTGPSRAGEPAPEVVLPPRRPAGAGVVQRGHRPRRRVRRGRPRRRAWRCTPGRSTTGRRWSALLDLGVDGIITDVPSVLAGLLEERGTAPGAGERSWLSRGRSSASCRGWPSSSCEASA